MSEPDAASIHQAIGKIVEEAKGAGTRARGPPYSQRVLLLHADRLGGSELVKLFNVASLESDFRLQQSNTKEDGHRLLCRARLHGRCGGATEPCRLLQRAVQRGSSGRQIKLGRIGRIISRSYRQYDLWTRSGLQRQRPGKQHRYLGLYQGRLQSEQARRRCKRLHQPQGDLPADQEYS